MEKKQFKAESQRLLDLMINSIYTHKEIFLREVISNASDALDKLCYKSLTDSSVGMSRSDFAIDIVCDKVNRVLTVSDNGIGMTADEMENNLGTIARSGSLDFKSSLVDKKEGDASAIDIIGQFGVGFYSAFMVSDRVVVTSRSYGSDDAWQWESTGADGYTMTKCERAEPGTDVVMYLKEDSDGDKFSNYLEEYTLASLIKKYSDYIRYPIRMDREKRRPIGEGEKPEYETYVERETVNSMIPIWQRVKSELTDEDLNAFYKEKFFDYQDPVKSIKIDAEGLASFKALLFIPSNASFDFYTKDFQKGLQLYSSGVLIMDKCADLLPEHFRFVRGVVDSPDLSLNISREMLQHDRQLKVIASSIEKRIRSELLNLLENDRETYEKFFENFGMQLKYGVASEFGAHAEGLRDLLLFSTSSSDKLTTLAEYCERMPEDQKDIYFATGESRKFIEALPQAEAVREKGYEILYFIQEVDEFAAQAIRSYKEKELKSINHDELNLETDEEKKDVEQQEAEHRGLLDFIRATVGEEVRDVKISRKLRNFPACITSAGGLSFEMEKYLKSFGQGNVSADRVLELNAGHPIFAKLESYIETDKGRAEEYVKLLLDQAKLLAGLGIDDLAAYSERVFSLM